MRLARSALLGRLAVARDAGVALLEAPAGYGKSWLARRTVPATSTRLRGALDGLADGDDGAVLVDDAHLLSPRDVARLADLIERSGPPRPIVVAGRLLAPELHEAAHLVDGLVLTGAQLAVTSDELAERDEELATVGRVIAAADGCIRIVGAVLDELARAPSTDTVSMTARMVRATVINAQHGLSDEDRSTLGLLARVPGLEATLLERLAGAGFVARAAAAGVPLRRQVTGALELALADEFAVNPVTANGANALADELVRAGRPVDAATILLDAGRHGAATALLADLNESVVESMEPRTMLNLLARLGPATEHEPTLLLWRAGAARDLGHLDRARVDIDRAVGLAAGAPRTVRHRVDVEAARARLSEGNVVAAELIVEQTLRDLGPGEERTYARAYDLLGQCSAMSDRRIDLQRAVDRFQVAAAAWEGCGERVKARTTRSDLAMSALIPLGRLDEALAVLSHLLASPDLSDTERSWVTLMEGFALYHANRLDRATDRFDRVADLGHLYDNPRLTACAAWGAGLVAWRRDDRAGALRHLANAENTALGRDDDVLGVPFLCDTALVLGAFGEFELAEARVQLAIARRPLFPDQVASAQFILHARRGELGDIDAALAATQPLSTWRIHLVAAYALARAGDVDAAGRHRAEAERELVALGFGDPTTLGEARLVEALDQATQVVGRRVEPPTERLAEAAAAIVVRVIGPAITLEVGGQRIELGPGNPQRLLGVVISAGGTATLDRVTEALWPGDPVNASRARLRNVLMRLRRGGGDLIVRSGSGVRLAPEVRSDLQEFLHRSGDALAVARTDPDLAGRLASRAVALVDGSVFADYEFEDWAIEARRTVDAQLIRLLDLLSVQAEDAGDLAAAQAHAERALQLDRYSDSRYVRLSELLTMQNRVAAAIAVLDDATQAARELGDGIPTAVRGRREELLRRAADRSH